MRRAWFCKWETGQIIRTFGENLNFGCGEPEPHSKHPETLTLLITCKSPVTGPQPAKRGSRSVVLTNRRSHWRMETNQRNSKRFRFLKASEPGPQPRWCGSPYGQPECVAFLAAQDLAQRRIPPVLPVDK